MTEKTDEISALASEITAEVMRRLAPVVERLLMVIEVWNKDINGHIERLNQINEELRTTTPHRPDRPN